MEATRTPLRCLVLGAIDRPAREVLLLAERPSWVTAGLALLGAVMVAGASFLSLSLDRLHFGDSIIPRIDVLRAMFEALAVVVPSAVVLAGYFRLRVSLRAMLGAVALGLFIAGVVVMFSLPFMAYVTLFPKAAPLVAPGAALPIVGLAAAASTTGRIVRTIDRSVRAGRFVACFQLGIATAFVVRLMGL